jgi:hypothetical protein
VEHVRIFSGGATTERRHGHGVRFPSAAGTQTVGFSVQDIAQHSATAKLTLSIAAVASAPSPSSSLTITTTTLPTATVGAGYNCTLAAQGGTGPYTWSITSGTLPQGLLLDSTTGTITGTPTQAGDQSLKVQVRDSTQGRTTTRPRFLLQR